MVLMGPSATTTQQELFPLHQMVALPLGVDWWGVTIIMGASVEPITLWTTQVRMESVTEVAQELVRKKPWLNFKL